MVATLTACLYGGSSLHQEGSSGKKKYKQTTKRAAPVLGQIRQRTSPQRTRATSCDGSTFCSTCDVMYSHGGLPCLTRGDPVRNEQWTQIRSDHSVSPPFLGSQASWRFNSSRHGTASGCRSHLLGVLEQSKRGWTFQNVFNAVKGINVNINFADSSCSNSPNEFARRAQKKNWFNKHQVIHPRSEETSYECSLSHRK